jgi:hypothetical protein
MDGIDIQPLLLVNSVRTNVDDLTGNGESGDQSEAWTRRRGSRYYEEDDEFFEEELIQNNNNGWNYTW